MELTKYAHACVVLTKADRSIVLDPGTLTPDAATAVATAEAVFVTHEHADHFDEEVLRAALAARPELRLYGPAPVVARFAEHGDQVRAVSAGDRLEAGGFTLVVHGALHASIHADIPRVDNVGYLVDDGLYHPGDAYHVPDAEVGTLLLPTSGPWTKFGEAADYVRAVRPAGVIQIHELMLSEVGQHAAAHLLGENGLTGVPFTRIPVGDRVRI